MTDRGKRLIPFRYTLGYLAHPFIHDFFLPLSFVYTATAVLVFTPVIFSNPLPDVAGVLFVDASSASSTVFGVSIMGLFSTWWAEQWCLVQ